MILYLDSSAIVKLFVSEVFSDEVQQLFGKAQAKATSRVAYVEVCSAFARRFRGGFLTKANYETAFQELTQEWPNFGIYDLDELPAGRMALKHGLRGFDAVHLAAALEARADAGTIHFQFCSFDKRQIVAARAEKLAVFPAHV